MGILGSIAKTIGTEASVKIIKAAGSATAEIIGASANAIQRSGLLKEDSKVKHGILYIKPSRAGNEYAGNDAVEIANELLGCGFEQVQLVPRKHLGSLTAKKYGRVTQVTINGKTDFLQQKKVPSTSYIVVEYSEFKDNVNPELFRNVNRIIPGTVSTVLSQYDEKIPETVTVAKSANFCPNCGSRLDSNTRNFCPNCGTRLN